MMFDQGTTTEGTKATKAASSQPDQYFASFFVEDSDRNRPQDEARQPEDGFISR